MLRWFIGGLLLATVQSVSAQYFFVSAPSIMRAGNTETVSVNVIDINGPVSVSVGLNLANGRVISPPRDVNVDPANPQIVQLFVDPDVIEPYIDGPHSSLFAKVVVSCTQPRFQQEKPVLVSFEEGSVFIQTDKPIYTPDQRVKIRLFILDQHMQSSDQQVKLDILTPLGVIVHRQSDIRVRNGLKAHTFPLPPEPVFGNWSVVASYGPGLKYNRSIQFEVKKYVLPTFSVVLTTPEYILNGTEELEFSVSAKYVYHKPVLGRYYAKVGIVESDGEITIKEKFAGPLDSNGKASFRMFTQLLGENWFNETKRLYTEVSVRETASGISENTSDSSTMFVRTPYVFNLDRTIMYYQRALPFLLEVELRLVNGQPAKRLRIEVTVTDGSQGGEIIMARKSTDDRGRVSIEIVPPSADRIHIKMVTKNESLAENAECEFDMDPHTSPSGKFLKLIPGGDPNVGEDLLINVRLFNHGRVDKLIHYVVNKGQIEQLGIKTDIGDSNGGQFPIDVTYSMVPALRVVALFISEGDVIADSVWIEIPTPACENRLTFRKEFGGVIENDQLKSIPGKNVKFQVTGEPSTTVGLLGVDKAVYLLQDYHRLTPDKMFRTMGSYDTGCGPGGGRDVADIFKNAGLIVLSNANIDVESREDFGCETRPNSRRRRSVEDVLQAELARFEDDEEKIFACKRGHRPLGGRLNCEERASRFADLLPLRFPDAGPRRTRRLLRIFMECCERAASLRSDGGPRAREGGVKSDTSGISDFPTPGNIRSDFRETWIFQDVTIGDSGEARLVYTAPSSITEWHITAVGLSDAYPMCMARPLDILIEKDLFIQLDMPYSVIRKEQVEIIATIFNYRNFEIQVDVAIKTPEEICTQGTPGVFSANKTVRVGGFNATSVRYVLIGLKEGIYPITVATAIGDSGMDAVRKNLRVEAEGIKKFIDFSQTLDPVMAVSQRGDLGGAPFDIGQQQVGPFDFSPLPEGAIQGSERCEVSVTGNALGPVVTAVIEGLESLLRVPYGCGEQTMISTSPNVYVLRYLASAGIGTDAVIATATSNIEAGVIREQTFMKADGSVAAHLTRPSSSWLTAFVAKVFCHSQEFIFVDPDVICRSMTWLLDRAQRFDGAFVETHAISSSYLDGIIEGDIAFTSFIVIALHECHCSSLSTMVDLSTAAATEYLHGQLDGIATPYTMAIATYALALVDSPRKHDANNRLKNMSYHHEGSSQRYWGPDGASLNDQSRSFFYRDRPSAGTIETTGYALLAQLALDDLSYSYDIANWMSSQQNFAGGFSSTQDTTIALQALSEYGMRRDDAQVNLDCSVQYGDRELLFDHISGENALVRQTREVPVNSPFFVHTAGEGTGKLNVRVTYNSIAPNEDRAQCPFKIQTRLNEDEEDGEDQEGRVRIVEKLFAEISYKSDNKTNMGIVDFGIPTGYAPVLEDLEEITNTSAYVARYEVSQRSVVFYVDYIPTENQDPIIIEFRIRLVSRVGNLQPVPILVYDYYNPTLTCTKFYTLRDEEDERLASICEGDACVCAAGDCLKCGPLDADVLKERSCTDSETFVYKIYMNDRERGKVGFDVFNATVALVLKGADDRGITARNNTREFWISTLCKVSCGHWPKTGQSFLVIGKTTLEYITRDNQRKLKYVLDQSATLIFWPPDGRRRKYRDQYDMLEQLQQDFFDGETSCQ